MEIDIRTGEPTTIDAIRFHDAAVIKQSDAATITVNANDGKVLVSIPKTARDDFILALQRSTIIFP